jgi:hypothetical protein
MYMLTWFSRYVQHVCTIDGVVQDHLGLREENIILERKYFALVPP